MKRAPAQAASYAGIDFTWVGNELILLVIAYRAAGASRGSLGITLNAPTHAAVFCVHEKLAGQTLNRKVRMR